MTYTKVDFFIEEYKKDLDHWNNVLEENAEGNKIFISSVKNEIRLIKSFIRRLEYIKEG